MMSLSYNPKLIMGLMIMNYIYANSFCIYMETDSNLLSVCMLVACVIK